MTQSAKPVWIGLTILAVIALLAGGWFVFLRDDAYAFNGGELPGGPAPDIALSTQHGEPFALENYRGQAVILYFGYTYCPDYCPTTMLDMMQVKDALGDDADRLQVVLVSVDPERDTPTVLKDYLSSFDPRLRGVTGDVAQIDAVEKSYRVYAKKVPTTSGDYTMDHTALVYLMDKQGRFIAPFNLKRSPSEAAADLRRYF